MWLNCKNFRFWITFLFYYPTFYSLNHFLTTGLPSATPTAIKSSFAKFYWMGTTFAWYVHRWWSLVAWLELMTRLVDSWWWRTGLMQQGFGGDELVFGYASRISGPSSSSFESREKARLYNSGVQYWREPDTANHPAREGASACSAQKQSSHYDRRWSTRFRSN